MAQITSNDKKETTTTTKKHSYIGTYDDAKCEFSLNDKTKKSPHIHETGVYDKCTGPISTIYDTVLDHIGFTPMIRINNITKDENIECEMVAKCEFYSAGGSVKDRIGKRMILDAEKQGRIKPGTTLIEPTSGNTGIGLALTAAIKGYKTIITLPEKMSQEKVNILKALGADIIRTPTEAAFDSPESHIGVAAKLNKEIQDSCILDQYSNPSNPISHYDGTGVEILKQCDNKVDMVVISAGTGGTITGVAARIKQVLPKCIIVGVDPHGSILAQPDSLNGQIHSYKVEGIGYDFIPKVLFRNLVDYWVKTDDKESFVMARRLIRQEGMLCGGSSGSVLVGAIKAIKHFNLKKDQRCVVLLSDSIRNYMSKHLSDDWLTENDFIEPIIHQPLWWHDKTISDLKLFLSSSSSSSSSQIISNNTTCKQVIKLFNQQSDDQLIVVDENKKIVGIATISNITLKLTHNQLTEEDPISKAILKTFVTLPVATQLKKLISIFNSHPYVVVIDPQQNNQIVGIFTRTLLLKYVTSHTS